MVQIATPWKHPKTGIYYLYRQIPERLRPEFGGQRFVKTSLRTKDPVEAPRLFVTANAELEKRFGSYFRNDRRTAQGYQVSVNRMGFIGTTVAISAATIGLGLFLLREPGLAANVADGDFAHDCCGALALRDGRMLLGKVTSVDYIVQQDEIGPYALPETFVGAWEDVGLEIDGSRPPVKLRLDKIPSPSRIEVPGPRGPRSFNRKVSPLGQRER